MKVLHVLDHSVPLFSGYSFRSRSIIHAQRALGLQPVVLTSPKHGSATDHVEELEGIRYYRTAQGHSIVRRIAFARELESMWRLVLRIKQVAAEENIDLIHSHSPLLNGEWMCWRMEGRQPGSFTQGDTGCRAGPASGAPAR